MNWMQLWAAAGLGLIVGAIVYVSGTLMDHYRNRRWNREMDERPPLPIRIPLQSLKNEDDA